MAIGHHAIAIVCISLQGMEFFDRPKKLFSRIELGRLHSRISRSNWQQQGVV
jgi:hypothetical protein